MLFRLPNSRWVEIARHVFRRQLIRSGYSAAIAASQDLKWHPRLLVYLCDAGQFGKANTVNPLDPAADLFAKPFRILSRFVFQFHFEE